MPPLFPDQRPEGDSDASMRSADDESGSPRGDESETNRDVEEEEDDDSGDEIQLRMELDQAPDERDEHDADDEREVKRSKGKGKLTNPSPGDDVFKVKEKTPSPELRRSSLADPTSRSSERTKKSVSFTGTRVPSFARPPSMSGFQSSAGPPEQLIPQSRDADTANLSSPERRGPTTPVDESSDSFPRQTSSEKRRRKSQDLQLPPPPPRNTGGPANVSTTLQRWEEYAAPYNIRPVPDREQLAQDEEYLESLEAELERLKVEDEQGVEEPDDQRLKAELAHLEELKRVQNVSKSHVSVMNELQTEKKSHQEKAKQLVREQEETQSLRQQLKNTKQELQETAKARDDLQAKYSTTSQYFPITRGEFKDLLADMKTAVNDKKRANAEANAAVPVLELVALHIQSEKIEVPDQLRTIIRDTHQRLRDS